MFNRLTYYCYRENKPGAELYNPLCKSLGMQQSLISLILDKNDHKEVNTGGEKDKNLLLSGFKMSETEFIKLHEAKILPTVYAAGGQIYFGYLDGNVYRFLVYPR